MYTVLIVDDEEPVLESFSHMLAEGVEGFSLAGVARNGFDAMKAIHELRPDVVFMDINMPGIDGLETISRVHETVPETVFALCTAYERFDLARRAIPLGVQAYLVKPVTKRMFVDTLSEIRDRLGRERRAVSAEGPRSDTAQALIERAFLRDELSRPITETRWRELRDALGLDSDRALVAFASVDAVDHGTDSPFDEVNRRLSLKYRFAFATNLKMGLYFVSGDADRGRFVRDLSAEIDAAAGREAMRWIGAGDSALAPDFSGSYAQAYSRFRQSRARSEALVRERLGIAALRQKIGFTPAPEYLERFSEWRDALFASLSFQEAKLRLVSLLVLLLDDETGYYRAGEGDGSMPFLDPPSEAAELETPEDCARWSDAAVRSIAERAERERTAHLPAPLSRALSYIAARFNEPLQLADVAEEARVSPAYLSRIFGEYLSVSFVEYITELRVETAERLLRERALSVKEVAHAVGFQDPNYFSKAFRKRTGLSPSAYAEQEHGE